jgi:hypothetical protein
MCCEHKGSIFISLNKSLQDSLLISYDSNIFLIQNILMLEVELPPKYYKVGYNGMYIIKIYNS